MPDFVRVRFKDSGTVQTIAKPAAVDENLFEVLDEPAADGNGRPLPPKFPEKKDKSTGQKAATVKESN